MTYCNPEFGCDCAEEVRLLKEEVIMLRVRVKAYTGIAVALMDDPHSKCGGSACTEECMRMTV